MFTETKNEVTL